MSEKTSDTSPQATKTPDLTPEEKKVLNLTRNTTTYAILMGASVEKEEYAKVAYRFTPTPRDQGKKLLTEEALKTAREISQREKMDESIRKGNVLIVQAHDSNLLHTAMMHRASIMTILATPIGEKSEEEEVTLAYQDLKALSRRLLQREPVAGFARKMEDRAQMLTGLAPDLYAAIKMNPEFADLVAAAEERHTRAKTRLEEIKKNFEDKYPKNVRQQVAMLDMVEAFQDDPDKLSHAEKACLVVSADKKPIFREGKLTVAAKDRLNQIQGTEGTPDFVTNQIRRIFAKNGEKGRKEAIEEEVGTGL